MTLFDSVLPFLGMLVALIVFHELGHYITAKIFGIKVLEAGLGYPPRVWGFSWRGTLYSVNWLPLGGFVRLMGEGGPPPPPPPLSPASSPATASSAWTGIPSRTCRRRVASSACTWARPSTSGSSAPIPSAAAGRSSRRRRRPVGTRPPARAPPASASATSTRSSARRSVSPSGRPSPEAGPPPGTP